MNPSQVMTAAERFQIELGQLNNLQATSVTDQRQKVPEPQDLNYQDLQATLPFLSNINLIPHLQNLQNTVFPGLNPVNGLNFPANPMLAHIGCPPINPFFSTPEKRQRTVFSINQLDELERVFALQKYVVGIERTELAAKLRLTEAQVKVWFQNRRIKERKNVNSMQKPRVQIQKPMVQNIQKSPQPSAYDTTKRQLEQANVQIQHSFNHIFKNVATCKNSTPLVNTDRLLTVNNSPSPVSSIQGKSPQIGLLKSQQNVVAASPTSDYSKTWLSYDLIKSKSQDLDEVDVDVC